MDDIASYIPVSSTDKAGVPFPRSDRGTARVLGPPAAGPGDGAGAGLAPLPRGASTAIRLDSDGGCADRQIASPAGSPLTAPVTAAAGSPASIWQEQQQWHQDQYCPLAESSSASGPDTAAANVAPSAYSRSPAVPSLAGRACYFLLGAGLLAAWNALITATDYFGAVYPGWHTDRLFTVAYLPLCMVMMAVGLRYPERPPPPVRIRLGFVGFTIAMAAVPLLDALMVAPAGVSTSGSGEGAAVASAPVAGLAAVVACVALVGACDGFCQGALFGEVAQLPSSYTHAVVMGTASSGFLICLLRMASKASFEVHTEDRAQGLRDGTRLYFALSGLLSLSCLLVYDGVLPRLRQLPPRRPAERSPAPPGSYVIVSSSVVPKAARSGVQEDDQDHEQDHVYERRPLLSALSRPEGPCAVIGAGAASVEEASRGSRAAQVVRNAGRGVGPPGLSEVKAVAESSMGADSSGGWLREASVSGGGGGGGGGGGDGERQRIQRCLALAWPLCAAVFMTYAVTLTIFPGFLAEDVHSADLGDWYPILLITAFNLADLVGKSMPCLEPLLEPPNAVATAAPFAAQSLAAQYPGGSPRMDGKQQQQDRRRNPLDQGHDHDHKDVPSHLAPHHLQNRDHPELQQVLLLHSRLAGVHGGSGGGGDGLRRVAAACGRGAAVLLGPLRRPHGLLLAAVLRGCCALPAFLMAARWRAPAWVMAALTASLGVSNGYLTTQVLTMGPIAVLAVAAAPPLLPPPATSPAARKPALARLPGSSDGSDYCPLPAVELVGHHGSAAAVPPSSGATSTAAVLQSDCKPEAQGNSNGSTSSREISWQADAREGARPGDAGADERGKPVGCDTAGAHYGGVRSVDSRCTGNGMPVLASGSGQRPSADSPGPGPDVECGTDHGFGPGTAAVAVAAAVATGSGHRDAEVVETLLVLSLIGGLNVGAYLGWLWLL